MSRKPLKKTKTKKSSNPGFLTDDPFGDPRLAFSFRSIKAPFKPDRKIGEQVIKFFEEKAKKRA